MVLCFTIEAKRKMLMKKMLMLLMCSFVIVGNTQAMRSGNAGSGKLSPRMSFSREFGSRPSALATCSTGDDSHIITGFDSGAIVISQVGSTNPGADIYMQHGSPITAVAGLVSRAGYAYVLSAASDGTVKMWSFEGYLLRKFTCCRPVHSIMGVERAGIENEFTIIAGTSQETYILIVAGVWGQKYFINPLDGPLDSVVCHKIIKYDNAVCNVASILVTEQGDLQILAGLSSGGVEAWGVDGNSLYKIQVFDVGSEIVALEGLIIGGATYLIAGSAAGDVQVLTGDKKFSFNGKDYQGESAQKHNLTDFSLRYLSLSQASNGDYYLLTHHVKHLGIYNLSSFLLDRPSISCCTITCIIPFSDCRCARFFRVSHVDNILVTAIIQDPGRNSKNMVFANRINVD